MLKGSCLPECNVSGSSSHLLASEKFTNSEILLASGQRLCFNAFMAERTCSGCSLRALCSPALIWQGSVIWLRFCEVALLAPLTGLDLRH